MPIPSNLTPATATSLNPAGTVSTTLAADVELAPNGTGYSSCDATQRHALWYAYTTGLAETYFAVGIRDVAFGSNYNPKMSIWTGTPPTLTRLIITDPILMGTINAFCNTFAAATGLTRWFNVPSTPLTTYYFQVVDVNSSTVDKDLIILCEAPPMGTPSPQGDDVVITDDSYGFPSTVIGWDGAIRSFQYEIPYQDIAGPAVPSGFVCVATGSVNQEIATIINASTLGVVATYDPTDTHFDSIFSDATRFYVLSHTGSTSHLQAMEIDGTLTDSWTLSFDFNSMNISRDGKTFYITDFDTDSTVIAVDLATMAQTTIYTGDPDVEFVTDLEVTIDGTIVTAWRNFDAGTDSARLFTSGGGLILDTLTSFGVHRGNIFLGANQWAVWGDDDIFRRIAIPSMTILESFSMNASSQSGGPTTALNGESGFVMSDSCPLIIWPGMSQEETLGPIAWMEWTRLIP